MGQEAPPEALSTQEELKAYLREQRLALIIASAGEGRPEIQVYDPHHWLTWFPPCPEENHQPVAVYLLQGTYSEQRWKRGKDNPFVPPGASIAGIVSAPGRLGTLQYARCLDAQPWPEGRYTVTTADPEKIQHVLFLVERMGGSPQGGKLPFFLQFLIDPFVEGMGFLALAGYGGWIFAVWRSLFRYAAAPGFRQGHPVSLSACIRENLTRAFPRLAAAAALGISLAALLVLAIAQVHLSGRETLSLLFAFLATLMVLLITRSLLLFTFFFFQRKAGESFREALLRASRPLSLLAMMGMIAAMIGALALVDVPSQVTTLEAGRILRRQRAVFFTPYYPPGEISQIGDEAVQFLNDLMEARQAYSVLVSTLASEHPPMLAVFGDAFPERFPTMRFCAPVPCAAPGANVRDPGAALSFGGEAIPLKPTLPASARFFDPLMGSLSLKDRLVMRLPGSLMLRLNAMQREELFARSVLLTLNLTPLAGQEYVDAFVSAAARDGLYLVPHFVSQEEPGWLRERMMQAAMYLVGWMAFLVMCFQVFTEKSGHFSDTVSFLQEIRSESPDYPYGTGTPNPACGEGGLATKSHKKPPPPVIASKAKQSPGR